MKYFINESGIEGLLAGGDSGFETGNEICQIKELLSDPALGEIRGLDRAQEVAEQLFGGVKALEERAINMHSSLDPRRVFELLQPVG